MDEQEKAGVQSAARLMRLLEVLSAHPDGASLQVLSAECGLPKSTAHRLLRSLAAAGYVRQAPGSTRYQLTMRLFSLVCAQVHNLEPVARLTPRARALAQRTGLTVLAAVPDGNAAVTVLRCGGPGAPSGFLGQRRPLYCTCTGLAILATLPWGEVEQLWGAGAVPYTPSTITSLEGLAARLERVRTLGYALEHEEYEPGLHGVAVALTGPDGRARAALGAYGPTEQLTEQTLAALRAAAGRG